MFLEDQEKLPVLMTNKVAEIGKCWRVRVISNGFILCFGRDLFPMLDETRCR